LGIVAFSEFFERAEFRVSSEFNDISRFDGGKSGILASAEKAVLATDGEFIHLARARHDNTFHELLNPQGFTLDSVTENERSPSGVKHEKGD
jgi:hypothetical protein